MGRLQLSQDEGKDRDPEGTRTCLRYTLAKGDIQREIPQLKCFQKFPKLGLNPNSDL